MNYNLTRRGFLGATLAAIPGFAVASALTKWSLFEGEYTITNEMGGFPPIIITTYTSGLITAKWGDFPCDVIEKNGWKHIQAAMSDGRRMETRVKRFRPCVLDIDWVAMASNDFQVWDDFTALPDIHDAPFGLTSGSARELIRIQ